MDVDGAVGRSRVKWRCVGAVLLLLMQVAVTRMTAQTPVQKPAAAAAQAAGTRVHGTITDPDGELIPGATITLTPQKGRVISAKSGSDGTYSVTVKPGTYKVMVSMPGFASFEVPKVAVPAASSSTFDAKLQIGVQSQVVTVQANDAVELSVDPDSNQSTVVITGKDLEALSDDPNELSSELTALAGPSAGPDGGQIYVDGFTGGTLPPKSSIREVRVNQNPFSAEYDKVGYGRIEVFTKPGTDKLHGNIQLDGDASQFNSPDPLARGYQPPYHILFFFGNLTGPLSKTASYNLGSTYRQIQQDEETQASILALPSNPTALCIPPNTTGCVATTYNVATYYPQRRMDINPRLDLALGSKNVLTLRYQYVNNIASNAGLGNFTLPSAGYNLSTLTNIMQVSDSETVNSHFISEQRFEYQRKHAQTSTLSTAPTIVVEGALTGGGYTGQNLSDHQDRLEFQSYNSLQLKKNFVRFGVRLRTQREAQNTENNTNGTFTYSSLCFGVTVLQNGSCSVPVAGAGGPGDQSYQTGTPSQFTFTRVNNHDIGDTYLDFEPYAESDWKARPNLTISYGIRYEMQNHLSDYTNIAPRLAVSYGLFGGKGAPKIVLRGGYGIFYSRFTQADILTTEQENGVNETVYTVNNPGAGCNPSVTTNLVSACGATAVAQTTYTEAPNLRTPYLMEFAGGVDQQLGRYGTVSVTYMHSQGVHQFATQNVGYNFANPSLTTAQYQFFSEGIFKQNQMVVHGRVQTSRGISLFGYYALNSANGDTSGAMSDISTPGNLRADYGRTMFDVRNRLFMAGSIALPMKFQLSPFMIAQSGNPYDVTTGLDNYNDAFFNARPYLVPASLATKANAQYVKTIPGCGTFAQWGYQSAGAQIAPINYCTGPALFTFNFRLTKAFGFGAAMKGTGAGPGAGGPHGGPGHHGPPGFGNEVYTGKRYNMSFGLQVQNLFNNEDPATPQGQMTSQFFGQSTQINGMPYTTDSAVRRITLQASFYF